MAPSDIQPYSFRAWMMCARPKTWFVALAPVLVGLSFAFFQIHSMNWPVAVATLLLSVLMQVISNMENDAGYTKKKAEIGNRKGLPRATSLGLLSVGSVEKAIVFLICIVIADTAFLIYSGGWVMGVISLMSVLAAYGYMGGNKPIAYSPFGEFLVFIFFGITAVCGTYYLQTGTVSVIVLIAACSLGFVAAAVLLVNNYRDIEHDHSVGRNTLTVYLGRTRSEILYRVMLLAPLGIVIVMVVVEPRLFACLSCMLLLGKARQLTGNLEVLRGNDLNAVLFGTVKMEMQMAFSLFLGAVVGCLM